MSITKIEKNMIIDNRIPSDSKLKGLRLLFFHEFIYEKLQLCLVNSINNIKKVSISYIRFKPLTSCIVTYKIEVIDKVTKKIKIEFVYAKVYTQQNYKQAKEKSETAHSYNKQFLNIPIYCDSEQIIFYPYYADREIQALSSLLDARKLRRVLYKQDIIFKNGNLKLSHKKMTYELLRYKPEKRALLKIHTICTNTLTGKKETIHYYIKSDTTERGKAVSDLLGELTIRNSNVTAPIYFDVENQLMVFKEIKAEPLDMHLNAQGFDSINKLTASLIADIHNAKISDSIKSRALNLKNDYEATAKSIITILPESNFIVDEILKALKSISENLIISEKVLLHGDFSFEQILLSEEKLYLLDFDRFSFGDFHEDIGNYIGHLYYKKISDPSSSVDQYVSDFLSEYESFSNWKIDEHKLHYWVAISLLQLAIKPFRIFEKKWDTKIIKTLKVVLDVIKG